MTGISWTDETWNPTRGCSRVSEGCRHCYAEVQAARIVRMDRGNMIPEGKGKYDGLVKLVGGEPRWTGKVAFDAAKLAAPLKWRSPRRIFVNSMSDLFHESLTNEQIAAVFGVMAAAPQHTFQCLTKRSKRMREWFEWALDGTARSGIYDATFINHLASKAGLRWEDNPKWLEHCENTEDTCSGWPLPNVWIGVSVENQAAADERIPDLLAMPAAVRFLSCEPLLGPVDLRELRDGSWHDKEGADRYNAMTGASWWSNGDTGVGGGPCIDWVITGCESGPGARPCDAAWLRSLRDQCAAAGVPFFLKQAMETRSTCPHCGGRDIATIPGYGSLAMWTCRCSPPSPGHIPAVAQGDGSRRKPGGVIELPYLDGVQHAAFPEVKP